MLALEDTKIPDNEMTNILSVYWQMLRELEQRIDPQAEPLDRLLVGGAYELLNRIGATSNRPYWESK